MASSTLQVVLPKAAQQSLANFQFDFHDRAAFWQLEKTVNHVNLNVTWSNLSKYQSQMNGHTCVNGRTENGIKDDNKPTPGILKEVELVLSSLNFLAYESNWGLKDNEKTTELHVSWMGFSPGTTHVSGFENGKYQSPVDIDPDDADIDDRLEKTPLTIQYIPEHTKCITNTGNTIRVDADGRDSVLSGGPLNSKKYRLDHFHFHWGKENSCGSEHTIKGCQYSAEIHLVHWNAEDYPNFAEAAKGEDGLAVIAVLIKVDDKEHSGMKTLTDCLPSIQYKGESRELPENKFDPKALFPKNTVDYWTYMGSLTTPPYYETVTWIIMKDSISVTQEQIDNFRSLLTYERGEGHLVKDRDQAYMGNNFRKTLPLEDRVIHASFV